MALFFFTAFIRTRELRFEDKKIDHLRRKVELLDPKFGKILLLETRDGAFTINRRRVHLCLKDQNGKYYDDNTLIYVLLHEIAHVLTPREETEEHGPMFYAIFEDLLEDAKRKNIWNPSIDLPKNYCGIQTS